MKLVKVNHPVSTYNAVDRLLNDFFYQSFQSDRYCKDEISAYPATNLYENDKSVEIELSIPGFEKDQVKIAVEKNFLVISGEVQKQEEQESKYARIEFKRQDFEKRFKISEKLDCEKIGATFKNGILKITVSKKEEAIPPIREIGID